MPIHVTICCLVTPNICVFVLGTYKYAYIVDNSFQCKKEEESFVNIIIIGNIKVQYHAITMLK